jgi:hypothetical protein
MSTKNLEQYLRRKNLFRSAKGEPEMKVDALTPKDFDELWDDLECDLSPENLHCDGEISNAEAMKKQKFLQAVNKEITSLYFNYHPE